MKVGDEVTLKGVVRYISESDGGVGVKLDNAFTITVQPEAICAAQPGLSEGQVREARSWKGVAFKDSVRASRLAEEIALHFAHDCHDSMCTGDSDESDCEMAWIESKLNDFLETLAASQATPQPKVYDDEDPINNAILRAYKECHHGVFQVCSDCVYEEFKKLAPQGPPREQASPMERAADAVVTPILVCEKCGNGPLICEVCKGEQASEASCSKICAHCERLQSENEFLGECVADAAKALNLNPQGETYEEAVERIKHNCKVLGTAPLASPTAGERKDWNDAERKEFGG